MDYLCCDPVDRDGTVGGSDGSVTCSTDEGILECDYDTQVTKLYHNIEERQWEEVLYFLETSKWYNAGIFSAFSDPEDPPSVQARTWVTALDESGNVRWCQLPLHAAVTFLAPISVIQKLVEVYPKSVRCADDQDMLPLHYAFRFGADDDVLLHLLEKFPQAITKKAVKERLPLDLAQYGPRPERGSIIDYYMQSAVRNAKKEWDAEYEKMVTGVRNAADVHLQAEVNAKNAQLVMALAELNRAKNELAAVSKQDSTTREREGVSPRSRSTSGKSKRAPKNGSNTKVKKKQLVEPVDEFIATGDLSISENQNENETEGETASSDPVRSPRHGTPKRRTQKSHSNSPTSSKPKKLEDHVPNSSVRTTSTRLRMRGLFGKKK